MTTLRPIAAQAIYPTIPVLQPLSRYTVFDEQRALLIRGLRAKGIGDERVLAAINAVAREFFVHEAFAQGAYADSALPIGCKQTISQPYTVAYMTSLLNVKPKDKILEIGTGSGYQAAILARLGARVFSVERFDELRRKADVLFERLRIPIETKLGDGTEGWAEEAPFDGIIVTAGAPEPPQALLEQLRVGGRLVIPVGTKSLQTLYCITKTGDRSYDTDEWGSFRFVPLVGAQGWSEETKS